MFWKIGYFFILENLMYIFTQSHKITLYASGQAQEFLTKYKDEHTQDKKMLEVYTKFCGQYDVTMLKQTQNFG